MNRADFRDNIAGIDLVAAEWMARQVRGLSTSEEAELSAWLRADIRHARVFTGLEATWRSLDRLKDARLPDGRRLDADLPPAPASSRRQAAMFFKTVLGAAAALALAYFGWWRTAPANVPFVLTAATEIGGFKSLSLPDGSALELNTDSIVEIAYTATERQIRLVRGEARFQVAKNPARPFVVQAGGIDVRAIGTVFNVRLRTNAIEVLVTEGKVRVNDTSSGTSLLASKSSAETPLLEAGERALIAIAPPVRVPVIVEPVLLVDVERALAWQERRLVFDATTLAEVVAEFNRYSRHKLVIADPRLNDRQFGGTFAVTNQEAFVRLLESRFGVKAEFREHETRLRLAEGETSP